ncbi:zinc-dependent peptidase [Algoriphagus confluentis]|uniref:Zinc-dependent peptidase n=2 Tax=Algoriphagus confluentis TaxID=1697556 RepID=A0ABQ6PNF9_9BACT|nr:zinc-dependent peptidase [Algoriphagus confluentis]
MAITLGDCHFCLNMFGTHLFIDLINEARWKLFPRKVSLEEVRFLEQHFYYFSQLKNPHKREFISRLETILSSKRFLGRGGLEEVTSEMELLIGATITMVVFGWKSLRLAHFHTILVYPNTYYSTINKIYHRGEVNPKHGLIVISWRCFVEGLADKSDGINLGIHEVAHALKLANWIQNDGEREFSPQAWKEYSKWVPGELAKVKSGQGTFFRESAGLNEHEFFAVALENFFERSREFKEYHAQLYQSLIQLLRQDPLVLMGKL